MSHQIYGENEQIFGYTGLRVKLYYSACRLTTYLSYSYKDKINPDKFEGVEADEVIKPIVEYIPPGYLTNVSDFITALDKDSSFRPFGEMITRFDLDEENNEKRTFEIYSHSASVAGFHEFHARLQTFILWYIDAASFIDIDDDKWRFFILYEKYVINGDTYFAVAGFTTVYEYYAYPDKVRPRISQMLVLPPFQRSGLGSAMLNNVYSNYRVNSRVVDITVEDPSDEFSRLRDYVDSKNCALLCAFKPEKLKLGFAQLMVDEAQEKFKLNKKQIRRVYEILRLGITDKSDKESYRMYRLEIKNRINVQYKKEDHCQAKLQKVLGAEEFRVAMGITSREQRLESLQLQYADLEKQYMHVLERLNA